MFLLLFLLSCPPAHADSPHLPPEMTQKVNEVSTAVADGYRQARLKMHAAERDSSLVRSVAETAAHLWARVKAKGLGAIVYLDHELHEHVIGPEGAGKPAVR